MANFSTLFPNLQDNLDFTVGAATGSANQIYGWAQADDTTKIPKNKLPDISLGHTYTFTTNAATEPLAIAAYTALFAAGGGTEANGAITGDVLDAGDLVIITYTGGATTMMLHLLYTGAQVTAGTDTPLDAAFINVTAGVTLTAGTNTSVGSDGTSIDLNSTINGMVGINRPGAGNTAVALEIGNDLGTRNTVGIHATTLSLDAGTAFNVLGGSVSIAGANNSNVALEANGSGELILSGNVVDVTASSTLELTSNRASGVAVDIDATQAAGTININAVGTADAGSIVIDAGVGELRLGGQDIGASGFLQVNAEGHVTTGTAGVGAYEIGTALIANQVAVLAGSTTYQLPSDANAPIGSWIKIFQNGTDIIISGLTNTQSIVGASDNTLSLDDTSANFEMIKTAANTWRVLSS